LESVLLNLAGVEKGDQRIYLDPRSRLSFTLGLSRVKAMPELKLALDSPSGFGLVELLRSR